MSREKNTYQLPRRGSSDVVDRLFCLLGKPDGERSATAFPAAHLDRSLVVRHDAVAHHESQSGAFVRTLGGVRLEVSDTGPGIPADHVDQIFDPFFTTKGPDEGSGLGLMVCHRIVTNHQGSIQVRSREGCGATFSMWLPQQAEEPVDDVA